MKPSLTKLLNKNIQEEWIYTSVILTLLLFILLNSELTQNSSVFSLLLFCLFFSIYMLYRINIKRKIYNKFKYLFNFTDNEQWGPASEKNLQYFELNKILDHLCEGYKNKETYSRDMEAKNKELRQIIDLVPHKIFAKDAQGNFIFVNQATAKGYGLTTEEMQGKSHLQLYTMNLGFPVKEVQEFLNDDLEVINSHKIKFIPEEENHETDGTIKIMQTTKIPFTTATSKDIAVLGIAIDITKIKADREKMEKNYEQLKQRSLEIDLLNIELEEFQHEIVHLMLRMLEIHDSYTKGHSENVANLSKRIAQELGLPWEKISQAYWAGILHDIGKTVVPKEILSKDNKLSDDEFTLIKNHSSWGHTVLKKSKQLRKISEYVLYHHERWDGTGYPHGLKSQAIPLISQILSIADCWDAMTSKRSYRNPLSEQQALTEIIENSGKQFNPAIVDVFLKMMKKEG
ncbi:MAG: PAS domain S-box-containing protein/putative nucleotidyltransferase with HDIG domain [Psychromonas sp.]|jgi:PAS domain S-box-containing protein/putative nucleotidyltransferase with HDIG domain|uniref:HD domain-containing phosphohydrolase n=1 Tax=Psychromonas sp. TaxID=1884585 RepID=UPI0039E573BA